MPLVTPRRTGLVEQVIEQLRTAIVTGEWPIGERIPAEPELAATLGVGRNTVREAVRALAHAGLLDVRQGDGTFVRANTELAGAVRKLCGSELREALEVRRMLEVDAARLAALRRTDDDLAALRAALADLEAAVRDQDVDRAVRSDAEFHLVVVRCAHNTLLAELYRGLAGVFARSVATTLPSDLHRPEEISHAGLVEAIAAQDVERAAREAGDFLTRLLNRR